MFPSTGSTAQRQQPFTRLSDSSSNVLVSPHPSHQTHIPMQVIQHNHDIIPLSSKSDEIEHDPLPPAVDFSGLKPSTRYQFRALTRRALSYHRRQRNTNICCLVIWPVLLVVFCFIISLLAGGDSIDFDGVVGFCVNEANPQTSEPFTLAKVPTPTVGPKQVAAWYPLAFGNSHTSSDPLPCVRWFGDSYPIKAPYENVTHSEPDRYSPRPYHSQLLDIPCVEIEVIVRVSIQ